MRPFGMVRYVPKATVKGMREPRIIAAAGNRRHLWGEQHGIETRTKRNHSWVNSGRLTIGGNYSRSPIVKWSSVMKLTLQRLHSYTLTSGSSSTPGIVRATIIGLEQFGQSGDWGCIFPPKRTRASLVGCNASPTQCFHLH